MVDQKSELALDYLNKHITELEEQVMFLSRRVRQLEEEINNENISRNENI